MKPSGRKSPAYADPAGLKSSIVKALFDNLISPNLPTRQSADEGVFASTAALSPLKRSLDLSLSEGDLTLTDEKTPVVRSCSQNMFFAGATSEKSSSSLQSLKERTSCRPLRKLKESKRDGEEAGSNGRGLTAEQFSWLRACRSGDVKRCRELLDTNPDLLQYVPPYHFNYSGVHIATNGQHYNLLRLLKEKGANFDAVTKSGYTPLHLAAQNQDKEMVDMLIHEFGVNTTVHDLMGYTYQHYADWLDYPDDDDLPYPLICRGTSSRCSSRQPSICSQDSLASSKYSLSRNSSLRGTIRGFLHIPKGPRSRSPSLNQLTV